MDKIKEVNKGIELDKKLQAEYDKVVTTKGMDAMIEGLKPMPKEKEDKPKNKD